MITCLPLSARRWATSTRPAPIKLASSTPITSDRQSTWSRISPPLLTTSDFMRRSPCEMISLLPYLVSRAGLKTWTRLRAIMARRRRRISSSLLPENIGPQITSTHPTLPLTNSIETI